MSRCGYSEDLDSWDLIRWRGQVASALGGKRGQDFLRELLAALDALPEQRLAAKSLVSDEGCCALGSVAVRRGVAIDDLDEGYAREEVAERFGIAFAMACEIMYVNDDGAFFRHTETPEQRFQRVRQWVVGQIVVRPEEIEEQR